MTGRRLWTAAGLVCLLAVTAGCTGFFAPDVTEEDLDKPPSEPYDWNTTHDVTITVGDGSYRAVYDLSNTTELKLYERSLGAKEPLYVRSVRYRYPNGTVINGSHPAVEVSQDGSQRTVVVPDGNGSLAYTADASLRQVGTPTFVEGSYEVILPPGYRAEGLVLGDIDPGGYETSVDEQNRLHLVWTGLGDTRVFVRYFFARDILIFRGLVAVLLLVGVAGALYFYWQIRRLEREREELGLNVDADADEFDDPPPGMG